MAGNFLLSWLRLCVSASLQSLHVHLAAFLLSHPPLKLPVGGWWLGVRADVRPIEQQRQRVSSGRLSRALKPRPQSSDDRFNAALLSPIQWEILRVDAEALAWLPCLASIQCPLK